MATIVHNSPKPEENWGKSITDTPQTARRTTKVLEMLIIPRTLHEYLQLVFDTNAVRPPIIHYNMKDAKTGLPKLYIPNATDPHIPGEDEFWVLFQTRSELPPKYRGKVIKWLAYVIGTVVHHVAIRKHSKNFPNIKPTFKLPNNSSSFLPFYSIQKRYVCSNALRPRERLPPDKRNQTPSQIAQSSHIKKLNQSRLQKHSYDNPTYKITLQCVQKNLI